MDILGYLKVRSSLRGVAEDPEKHELYNKKQQLLHFVRNDERLGFVSGRFFLLLHSKV